MKELLKENIARMTAGRSVAVSLSGGTDSLAMLFCCVELGIKPVCYTYTVQGFLSDDLKRAQTVTQKYGLALNIANIPTDDEAIINDCKYLIRRGVRGKVCIQCMHGHMHTSKLVKEPIILNGSGIDGLYGAYKQFILSAKKFRMMPNEFNVMRQKHLTNPNDDAMGDQSKEYGEYEVEVLYPYREKNVVEYMMGKTWDELNKPYLKASTMRQFPQFKEFGWDKSLRGSQQIMAGTRALHQKLLQSRYNTKGYKRVEFVYRAMEADL
jgi:asparagine synthetase B (glutamine-hydrolysing)